MCRCIIAGSRTITDYHQVVIAANNSGIVHQITEVICGDCRGVDTLGAEFARQRTECGQPMMVKHFPANWSEFGRRAGYLRNVEMAKYAAADPTGEGSLILIWDGQSLGSKMMKSIAQQYKLRIFERIVK
jgi:hypothetical protein